MDDVVDDRELGVQLGRLIFVHLDVPSEQPAVAVPRGGDRRIVVGLGGGDDPRPAARARPARSAAASRRAARNRRRSCRAASRCRMSRPMLRHQLLRMLKGPLNFHCSGPRHSLYSAEICAAASAASAFFAKRPAEQRVEIAARDGDFGPSMRSHRSRQCFDPRSVK